MTEMNNEDQDNFEQTEDSPMMTKLYSFFHFILIFSYFVFVFIPATLLCLIYLTFRFIIGTIKSILPHTSRYMHYIDESVYPYCIAFIEEQGSYYMNEIFQKLFH